MNEEQLAAFYADNARRWEVAKREFGERTHGWRFAPAAEAGQWAERFAGAASGHVTDPSAWAARLVEQADADGVIVKPEPGRIRSAYSHRDPDTEMDTAIGFGFSPNASEALIVHAGHAIAYDTITPAIGGDGAAVLGVLRAVVDSFATVRAFAVSANPTH
jgi:hypothetical protein